MKVYIVSLRFHWGYSIRNLFSSKMTDSYLIPPIATIIGALAKSMSVMHGVRVEHLVENFDVIGSSALSYITLIKNYSVKLESKPIKFTTLIKQSVSPFWVTTYDIAKGERNFFAPLQTGMVSYVGGIMRILIVCEDNVTSNYFYSINRLGSKESLACVLSVEELTNDKVFKTNIEEKVSNITFSFDFEIARPLLGSYRIEDMPLFNEIFYRYKYPAKEIQIKFQKVVIPEPMVSVITKDECYLYKTKYGNAILKYEL